MIKAFKNISNMGIPRRFGSILAELRLYDRMLLRMLVHCLSGAWGTDSAGGTTSNLSCYGAVAQFLVDCRWARNLRLFVNEFNSRLLNSCHNFQRALIALGTLQQWNITNIAILKQHAWEDHV